MNGKISIRISDSLRQKLSEISEMKNISVSEMSRTILEEYFESYETKSHDCTNDSSDKIPTIFENTQHEIFVEKPTESIKDIATSVEFFQLATWIYDQRASRLLTLDKNQLINFQNTIIKIHSSSIINEDFKNEFNKVFNDLLKIAKVSEIFIHRPDFAIAYSSGFNYQMLTDFIFKEYCGNISSINKPSLL